AELTDATRLRAEIGRGARFGAGGLWGGFGWLLTPRGKLSMYVSRSEPMVLIRFRARQPLLITPEQPERFLAALTAARP
ncbi:MAG TPA: PH domain-containing protein, partial [Myxococcota bacterium]|nr:PH domain-containing protein [Myxococcota bacterium]